MKKVFLGGTCNGSTWRNDIIAMLEEADMGFFNPVVKDWNKEAQEREVHERMLCDYCLYAITPKMTGAYAIAEAVDDSNKRPTRTILVLLRSDAGLEFTFPQWKSLQSVANMVRTNRAKVFFGLKEAVTYMKAHTDD